MVAESEQCQYGELGSLLQREGLTYAQIGKWRTAYVEGTLDKKRVSGCESESCRNASLRSGKCPLEEAIGTSRTHHRCKKKLARLLEEEQSGVNLPEKLT